MNITFHVCSNSCNYISHTVPFNYSVVVTFTIRRSVASETLSLSLSSTHHASAHICKHTFTLVPVHTHIHAQPSLRELGNLSLPSGKVLLGGTLLFLLSYSAAFGGWKLSVDIKGAASSATPRGELWITALFTQQNRCAKHFFFHVTLRLKHAISLYTL